VFTVSQSSERTLNAFLQAAGGSLRAGHGREVTAYMHAAVMLVASVQYRVSVSQYHTTSDCTLGHTTGLGSFKAVTVYSYRYDHTVQ
jgi:hypothetical protein